MKLKFVTIRYLFAASILLLIYKYRSYSGIIRQDNEPWKGGALDLQSTIGSVKNQQQHGKRMVLLLSSMPRSGSTLLAEILSSKPGSVLFFEPLWIVDKTACINETSCVRSFLENVFQCTYEDTFETWLKSKHLFAKFFNKRVRECLEASDKSCMDVVDLRTMCQESLIRIMKVIRTRLSGVEAMLSHKNLNLKIIHLVRDPRGSLNSINPFKTWVQDPHSRCSDVELDMDAFDKLSIAYPGQLMQVTYEELCLDPITTVRNMNCFLYNDCQVPEATLQFINSHMTKTFNGGNMETRKDSKTQFQAWRWHIKEPLLQSIEKELSCASVIQRLGHQMFNSLSNANNLSIPLL